MNPKDVTFKPVFRVLIAVLTFTMAFLAGCQGLTYLDEVLPKEDNSVVPTQTLAVALVAEDAVSQATATQAPLNYRLTVWLPPQFNPNEETTSSKLLSSQFKSFTDQNPEISLDIRVKAASGAGNILDTLDYASQVAADAEPDLVLLSRSDLEAAAQKGLLQPIEEVSSTIDESDWYSFAQSLGIVQGTACGLPFAADALGLIYRNTSFPRLQPGWSELNSQINDLIFPAADPTALTTLAIYLSAGGSLQDAQGQAAIDVETLTKTLQIYQTGLNSGLFANELLQLQSDDQAWESFQNSKSKAIITWTSRQLQDTSGLKLALLPGLGAEPYTLAKGWVWCLVSKDPQKKKYASQLVEHMVDPEFLKTWAPNSGYLPVRPSSLAAWENPLLQDTLGKILNSAQIRPNPNLLSTLINGVKTAVQEVLSGQSSPADSARKAAASLEVVE